MAVIQSAGENIGSGIVSDREKMTAYGEMIKKETRRLDKMIGDILTYSGIESGKHQDRTESCRPADVITVLKESLASLAGTLEWNIDPLPETLPLAGKNFYSILENLIVNGIKHTKINDKEASVKVSITKQYPPPGIIIKVEDTGPGIPKKEQKRVCQPFIRGERSTLKQISGNGLGLYLVKKITQNAGGKIALESPYRDITGNRITGCRFTVEIPITNRGED